jgi:cyclophilin family peptidyl-prolyl cis-trans isomerase
MRRSLLAALAAVVIAGCAQAENSRAQAENPRAQGENPRVLIKTNMGDFTVELYPDKAPATVKNFLGYADDKFYDNTIFHRVAKRPPVIQGGGFEPGLKPKKTKDPIKNEAANGLSNVRGTIAMARTDDPDSATSQFYINTADNKFLDKNEESAGYCVFGKVVEGLDVVDKIKNVEVGPRDVPTKDVVIMSVRRVEK